MARHEELSISKLTVPTVTSPVAGSYVSLSLTPAAVATIVAAYQDFTVAGLAVGDAIIPVQNPISNAVSLVSARCTTANTLALQFVNPTAGNLTPTAGTYTFLVIKPS